MKFFLFLFFLFMPMIGHAQTDDDYFVGTVESFSCKEQSCDVIVRDSSENSVSALFENNPLTKADDLVKGDRVVVFRVQDEAGETRFYITDQYRLSSVALLFVFFFFGALIFAGKKGMTAILGLGLSLAILILYTIPSILNGQSPFLVATISAFVIAIVSLNVAHGFSKQTVIALASTLITLVLALGLSQLFVVTAKLFGSGTEESSYLQISGITDIDLRGLLLAGIIIGVLGVLDDVTTTQTAAIKNLGEAGVKNIKQLVRSGMDIGREHITSLVNTLALAYAGASLPLLLVFSVNDEVPNWVMLNSEFIVEEVVRTLVGSTTLILAVPISTVIAAWFYSHRAIDEKRNT